MRGVSRHRAGAAMTTPTTAPRPLGAARCRCVGCREHFNGPAAFDRHRVGEFDHTPPDYGRRCLPPDGMRARGMTTTADGRWWVTRRMPAVARLRRRGGTFGPIPPTDAPP